MPDWLPPLLWLFGFAVFVPLCFILKDDPDKRGAIAIDALLVYATVFVVSAITGTLTDGSRNQNPVMEADKAEFCMRLGGLMETFKQSSSMFAKSAAKDMDVFSKQESGVLEEANKSLETATKAEPKKPVLRTKQIVVAAESGRSIQPFMDVLQTIEGDKAKELHRLMKSLYVDKKVSSKTEYEELHKVIQANLKGWFKDVTKIQLSKVAGHKEEHKKLLDDYGEKCLWLLYRGVACCLIVCGAIVFGSIVILVQLFFLSRRVTAEKDRADIAAPGKWGIRTVYGVFIAWLSLEFLIAPYLHVLFRAVRGSDPSPTLIAMATAISYILTNGPALFFIWFLAFRKEGINFVEGVRFRLKSGTLGPVRITMAGILCWTAAVPIVLVAAFAAQKFLHSQGSNNPIIPIVLEAARSNDIAATLIFFFTLGILPALCEETLFRGFLYTSLRRSLPVLPSIAISALLFSLAHLDAGGAVQLFVLGSLFAFVFERTKSLLASMVTHCLWNSGTFAFMILLFGG